MVGIMPDVKKRIAVYGPGHDPMADDVTHVVLGIRTYPHIVLETHGSNSPHRYLSYHEAQEKVKLSASEARDNYKFHKRPYSKLARIRKRRESLEREMSQWP